MLDHMIDYLRATLDGSRATTHALQSEFDRVRDYLEVMAIRMGPRLAFALDLPPELQQVAVPTLVLQPLVENSIQHGLEPKVCGGRIDVRATREGELLVLEVSDTGVGGAGGAAAGNGFGLQQIRDRLQSLYGERARLDFHCGADGAQARIALPIA
jgi:LytS/YehU family sensor histidine kinase